MNNFFYNKIRSNKIISISIILFVILLIIIPLFYLQSVRKSDDPRVYKVKVYYKGYENAIKNHDLQSAFIYLDSIQLVYNKYIDYKNSNEMGQVLNRKAVNWIQFALNEKDDSLRLNYLDSARFFAENSITLFEEWMKEFTHLSRNEIIIKIQAEYLRNDSSFSGRNLVNIINKRTDEIIKGQKDTPRHLSFAYTNLGSVYQYFGDYKMAIKANRKALDIWGNNETAKNNIKSLIDRSRP